RRSRVRVPSAPPLIAKPPAQAGGFFVDCPQWRQGPPFGRGAGSGLHCPARHQALIFPMLQKLRDKTSGWIVTVIMGLLMIPFLFVIDNSYLGGVGGQNVAKVSAPPSWWRSAPSWWPMSFLWSHHEISNDEF